MKGISDKVSTVIASVDMTKITPVEKAEIKKDIISSVNCFIDYFNQVVSMEIRAASITTWGMAEEFIFKSMDEERGRRHDLCVAACYRLNNICHSLGLPKFYAGTIEDRHEIAAFCGVVVSDLYFRGIREERTFDDLVHHFAVRGEASPLPEVKEEDFRR